MNGKAKLIYSDCPQLIKDFLFYMETIKGRSPKTVQGYYIDLRTFFRFICSRKALSTSDIEFEKISITSVDLALIKEISLNDVYEFLHYTSVDRNNSAVTRSRKVSSIRSFFNYLTVKVNLLTTNPLLELEVPSTKRTLPKYLSLTQCKGLLNNVSGEYQERDFCMIILFLNCGIRLSELVGLNLKDIGQEQMRVLGKGNKERMVYLNEACKEALGVYLEYRNNHTINPTHKQALFLTRNGTRIGARRVEQIIDEHMKAAGLDEYGFSTHKLRHTAATIMYQNGNVDIRVLQSILGHANLGTTEIYTHISNEQMKKAMHSTPLASTRPHSKNSKNAKNAKGKNDKIGKKSVEKKENSDDEK